MPEVQTSPTSIEMDLPDEAATAAIARSLAGPARPGDVFTLTGALGTGKTVFARAFIRARGGASEEVPSPTFTLVQVYELPGGTVYHFDLFRIADAAEVFELGMEEAFAGGISLIEWPHGLDGVLPADRVDVALCFARTPEARRVRLTGYGTGRKRLREAGLA